MKANVEGHLSYNQTFGDHSFNGLLLYLQNSHIVSEQSQTMHRNGLMLQLGYDYQGKYLVDVLVNRAGTSVLAEGDKYRTYPAISAGWIASNEVFLSDVDAVDFLKVRASYGKNGYDAIDYYLDKQFWGGGNGYFFGSSNSSSGGSSEKNLAMESFNIETSNKFNLGVDANLFGGLSLTIDAFMDQRRDMLVTGNNVVGGVIGIGVPEQNVGAIDYKGLEISAMWKGGNNDFNYYIGGNVSFLKSEIIENGEGYKPYDYLSAKGLPEGQAFGLEAVGFFNDQADIDNSSQQVFSQVRPGDNKYKNQNDDDVIDQYSKFLNTADIYWPLRNNKNISNWYLNEMTRWTEDTKATADLPRLTTLDNANNFRNSTQWLVDGSYLKLRNLKVYYNLPTKMVDKLKMEQLQVFVSGNNLLSFDNVPYLNCEDLAKDYFEMMSVYAGVKINF